MWKPSPSFKWLNTWAKEAAAEGRSLTGTAKTPREAATASFAFKKRNYCWWWGFWLCGAGLLWWGAEAALPHSSVGAVSGDVHCKETEVQLFLVCQEDLLQSCPVLTRVKLNPCGGWESVFLTWHCDLSWAPLVWWGQQIKAQKRG